MFNSNKEANVWNKITSWDFQIYPWFSSPNPHLFFLYFSSQKITLSCRAILDIFFIPTFILSSHCDTIIKAHARVYHTPGQDLCSPYVQFYYTILLPSPPVSRFVLLFCILHSERREILFKGKSYSIIPLLNALQGLPILDEYCNIFQVHYHDLRSLTWSVIRILHLWLLLHLFSLSYCPPAMMTDELWALTSMPLHWVFALPNTVC